MKSNLEKQWELLLNNLGSKKGEIPNLNTILFIIGLQELNLEIDCLTKDQKLEVIHVGLCAIFVSPGYYKLIGRDQDGWLHFKQLKKFPNLNNEDQENSIKQAIMNYYR